MTTLLTDAAIEVAGRRLNPALSPEWQYLLTHFELSEGFSFVVLLVPDEDWAKACRIALSRYLEAEGKNLQTVDYSGAEDFKVHVPGRLLELHPSERTGAVWLEATVSEAGPRYEEWAAAWRGMAARLNQFRNPLRRQIDVPLVFVGAHWIQPVIREIAPDLWSVRTMVTRLEPRAEPPSATRQRRTATSDRQIEGLALDPDFALETAERLRDKPGKQLSLAQLLHRAGVGFGARYRWHEAELVLREAVELRRKYNAPVESLASSLRALGNTLHRRYEFEEASAAVNKALSLYRQANDLLGQANCLLRLGDIKRGTANDNAARELYSEAISLYRQIGSRSNEANGIKKLAGIELESGEFPAAQNGLEQALSIYRTIGDVAGEAGCILGLAEIASLRLDLRTAQILFSEALALYESVKDLNGKAECLKRLGDIHYERLDLHPADVCYRDAFELFSQAGDVRGEADCLVARGDIGHDRQDEATALGFYQRAAILYEQVGRGSIGGDYAEKLREVVDESFYSAT